MVSPTDLSVLTAHPSVRSGDQVVRGGRPGAPGGREATERRAERGAGRPPGHRRHQPETLYRPGDQGMTYTVCAAAVSSVGRPDPRPHRICRQEVLC